MLLHLLNSTFPTPSSMPDPIYRDMADWSSLDHATPSPSPDKEEASWVVDIKVSGKENCRNQFTAHYTYTLSVAISR